jgi:hypothetical protein
VAWRTMGCLRLWLSLGPGRSCWERCCRNTTGSAETRPSGGVRVVRRGHLRGISRCIRPRKETRLPTGRMSGRRRENMANISTATTAVKRVSHLQQPKKPHPSTTRALFIRHRLITIMNRMTCLADATHSSEHFCQLLVICLD